LTRENEGHWLYFATNAHRFDVTDVHREGLIKLVSDKMLVGWKQDGRFDPTLAFLPAPLTWIEFTIPMPDGDITSATVLFHYTDEKADKNIASLNSLIVGRDGERHFLFEDVTAADDLVLRGEIRTCDLYLRRASGFYV
jgi:hypothetical protein